MQDALAAATSAVTSIDPSIPDDVANDQPTKSELLELAAVEMFELNAEIDRLTALLAVKKTEAIELFGAGVTYALKGVGKVQVIGATEDRPSGKIEPKFDLTSFLNATPELKAQLEKTGIVRVVEGITRGVKAQVRLVKAAG